MGASQVIDRADVIWLDVPPFEATLTGACLGRLGEEVATTCTATVAELLLERSTAGPHHSGRVLPTPKSAGDFTI